MTIIDNHEWAKNTVIDMELNHAIRKQDMICILGIELIMEENAKKDFTNSDLIRLLGIIEIEA